MAGGFVISHLLLGLGVVAYGVAGARLAHGSRESSPLRSVAWWTGTALQGVGFLFTFSARRDLPLMLVQVAVVGGLAVTAIIEHAGGRRRLTGTDIAAVGGILGGLAAVSLASRPSPAVPTTWSLVALVLGLALVVAGAAARPTVQVIRSRWGRAGLGWWCGAWSGVGFGLAAVAARLVMGRPDGDFWRFWTWSLPMWAMAACVPLGLALGQLLLTYGLRKASALPVLGCMYLLATLAPMVVGIVALDEVPREGMAAWVVAGVLVATFGAARLLKGEVYAETVTPAAGPDQPATATSPATGTGRRTG